MQKLLENMKYKRNSIDNYKKNEIRSRSSMELQEAVSHYNKFNAKTRYRQLSDINKSLSKEKKWNNHFEKKRSSFSRLSQEHMIPQLSNWQKEQIQYLQRSYKNPQNYKGIKTNDGKTQFVNPTSDLYSNHYKPIVEQKIKYNQDFELSTSKFGDTWVDQKRKRIIPKLKVIPFNTEWRNDNFRYYKYTKNGALLNPGQSFMNIK